MTEEITESLKAKEYQKLYLKMFRQLVSMFRRNLPPFISDRVSTAEDLAQETFMKAWWGWDQYEAKNDATRETWIYRIGVYLLMDWRRVRKNLQPNVVSYKNFDAFPTGAISQEDEQRYRTLLQTVEHILDAECASNYSAYFRLRHIEGLGIVDIQNITQHKKDRVKLGIHRAVKKLRKKLAAEKPSSRKKK